MTVRVNKSSFNIREKLSELGRKFGLKGSELAAAETVQEAREIVSAGRKNMVINGDMRISQRYGTTATTITAQTYVIDRYRCEDNTTGSTTHQQVTDAPPGFHNSLKVTVTGADTSVDAGDFHYFRQIIEGNNINHLNWGSSNAKTVTLSFWVKSSVTGNHGASVWNNAFNRSFPFIYTIKSANSWEYKSITIPGCTDGTWESGINRGINIGFVQNAGSVYQGPPGQWNSAGDVGPTNHVNLTATNGATWYITGLQLEVGRNATEFEHRSYGEELALCQRYYCKSYKPEQAPGAGTSDGLQVIRNYDPNNSRSDHPAGVQFPVTMRAVPNITLYSQNGTANRYTVGNTTAGAYVNQGGTISNILLKGTGSIGAISFSTTVPNAAFAYFHYTADAEF